MKVLIVEDELPAAERLTYLLQQLDATIEVIDVLDSIEDTVNRLSNEPLPDLIFMDIELADGQSFRIFEQVEIQVPVIFATAYDQYAIKAFKVNGLDYLLKPIDVNELSGALERFKSQRLIETPLDAKLLQQLISQSQKATYKGRFLVKVGEQLKYIPIQQIAYFHFDNGGVHLVVHTNRSYAVDYSLDQLIELLDPREFFRINRKVILNHQSIQHIRTWFNGRLKLEVKPSYKEELMVSRDRSATFKEWLDQ